MASALARRVVTRLLTPFRKFLSQPTGWWGQGRAWFPLIHEPFAGAWQQNRECAIEDVLAVSTVQACITLIAGDISKLPVDLYKLDSNGIPRLHENPAYSPVLRKPNHYQNRIQFYESWVLSKLIHGNSYVLKQRDSRSVVIREYIVDPTRTKPLVAEDGSVFYQLGADNLANVRPEEATVVVPASEIIHDRWNTFYHPLVGISPIRAAAATAMHNLRIQNQSSSFFDNQAQPSGILTSAGTLSLEEEQRIQQAWQQGFTGPNRGKVAVLGADLKFQPLAVTAQESQLAEQLKMTGEIICSVFHVPPYMVGVGPAPPYNNVQALTLQYLTQCLQKLIEAIELCQKEGLDLSNDLSVGFDEDVLLRMDTQTQVKAAADAIGSGGLSPNEARKRWLNEGPVEGGDSPYLQQQNFSLAALAKRDAQDDPFASDPQDILPDVPDEELDMPDDEAERGVSMLLEKALA